VALNLATGNEFAIELGTGFDLLTSTVDPLKLQIGLCTGPGFFLDASYDINTASLSEIEIWGNATYEDMSLKWSLPYNVTKRQFDISSFGLKVQNKQQGKISLSFEFDLNSVRLSTLALQAEILYEKGWGITLSGKADLDTQSISDHGFGLFHDLYDCLRVGIERTSGQVWLYTSILAFPEAILRYAPSTTSIEVGN
jgi:hypothetical protein